MYLYQKNEIISTSYIDFSFMFPAEVMMDIAKINPYVCVAMQSVCLGDCCDGGVSALVNRDQDAGYQRAQTFQQHVQHGIN